MRSRDGWAAACRGKPAASLLLVALTAVGALAPATSTAADPLWRADARVLKPILKPLVLWARQGGGDFATWVTSWRDTAAPVWLLFRWRHNLDGARFVAWEVYRDGLRIAGPLSVGDVPAKATDAFFSIPFNAIAGGRSGTFEVRLAAHTAAPPAPGATRFQVRPRQLARLDPPVTLRIISTQYQALYSYMIANSCFRRSKEDVQSAGCLETRSFPVTRKGGRRVNARNVYRWRFLDEHPSKPLYPHFLLSYLRLLRDAVAAGETEGCYIDPSGIIKTDYSCLDLLRDQLGYMEFMADKPPSLIVWRQGTPHPTGMVQAEMANIYLSIAVTLQEKGQDGQAQDLFAKALRIAFCLDLDQEAHSGGVRSKLYPCLGGKGWLYHSSTRDGRMFALNQQAHVIRDAISFYYHYCLYMDKAGQPVQAAMRTRLIDRFLKPLELLASYEYAGVPNLRRFMERKRGNGLDYYWCYYMVRPDNLQGENISHKNNCHYHKHTLEVFYEIFSAFKMRSGRNRRLFDFLNGGTDPRHREMLRKIDGLFGRLLDARRGPSGNRWVEPMGLKGSNNALYQFFLSETDPRVKRDANRCPRDDLATAVREGYRKLFRLD